MKKVLSLCMLLVASLLAFSSEDVSAAIQCYGCHGTSIPVDYRPIDASFRNPSSGGFTGNHRTHMDTQAAATACSICHPGSHNYTASHRDGLIKVSSRINSSPLTTLYKNTTTAWSQTAAPLVMGSCSNVNCHFETPSPTWGNDPLQTNCGTCHGAPPSGTASTYVGGAAGSHAKHDQYYPGSSNCKKCHPDNTTFKHATSGKRALKISFAAAPNNGNGSYSGLLNDYLPSQTNTFGNCTATYCHSPGTKGAAPFIDPNQTATWSGTLGCDGCHAAAPLSGSHSPHVATGYGVPVACYKCHAATVTSAMTISSTTKHVNGLINVAFDSTTTAVLGKYSSHLTPMQKNPGSGYANCENVYCHSSGQGAGGSWPPTYSAPKWGTSTTGKCGTCHDSGFHSGAPIASGSHTKHLLYDFAGATTQNPCGVCHYGAGFTDTACAQCHFGGGKLTTLHVNHQVDVSFTTKFSGTYNGTPEPGNGYGSCSSVYCHSSGTSVATGSIPANTTTAWGSGVLSCSGCHGNPPSYANNSPKKNSHVIHGAYGCNKCHYRTTTNGTSITNTTNHVNKVYDVYSGAGARFTYSYNASGGTCNSISCHGTGSQPAQWGSTSCLGCHSVTQGNRAAITGQFGANSHHIQGAITDAQCYQCHWEANSDGSINSLYHGGSAAPGSSVDLVVYGSGARPTSYTAGSTFVQYHYTTSVNRAGVQKITIHCLGCHSDQNNSSQPFGDGRTPKQYAWDGTSVAARYSQSGTTSWGKYTSASYPNTAKKKISKAFSSHGNTAGNQRGWDTTNGVDGTISNTSGSVNVECYDCHNSHGSTVAGITSRYSSATGRQRGAILKDTVANKGGYNVAYRPYTGGSAEKKNRRNPGASICLDCHMTPTAGTTPWGYTSTYGATQAILGYWDSPFMGYTTAGHEKRYPFKKANPMQGGHFGATAPLTVQPSSANQISGLCTPCHDPHGVSPTLGSKQQYSVPLLKGTWITSPYKEDTAPAVAGAPGTYPDQTGLGAAAYQAPLEPLPYHIDQNTFGTSLGGTIPASTFRNVSTSAGLCLGCHPKNSLTDGTTHTWKSKDRIHEAVNGWKTANGTIKHNYTCSKCHSAHTNAALPRLMVTDCLDSPHKGRSGFNRLARLAGGTSATGEYGSGSGSGRFPGVYSGYGSGGQYYPLFGPGTRTFGVTCHESPAANNGANSNLDQSWNVKTPWNNAGAPTGVSAMPGNTQVTISWTAGIGATSSLIKYGTATGVYGTPIDPATSPKLISGLTNGQTIYYQVGANNAGGTTWSAEYSVTPVGPPAAPTGISAIPGIAQVTISWTAGIGATSSLIKYGTTSGVYGVPIDSATSPTTIAGLTNGTTYYYQIGAKNAVGTTWSAEYSVTPASPPAAPTGISATPGNSQMTISWTAGTGAASSLIKYGTSSGVYGVPIDPATSPGTIAGLTNGTIYYYQVGAKNVVGTTWSAEYSMRVGPPAAPTAISGTPGNTQVTISWTAGAGAASSLIKYGTTSGVYGAPIDPATSPQAITGLTNGTNIYYRVGAFNAAGTTWSAAEYIVTPVGPPAAPTGISTVAANAQATISWTAGTGSTSSLIRYGTATGTYATTIASAVSPQTITGLANGTPIYYQVGANNAGGTTWSAESSVTPTASAPLAATSITATPGNTQATISWTAGTGSTSSLIRYGTATGTYTTTIASAVSPRTITGLANGTPIYYQVGAMNGSGTTWSAESSVTPLAPPSAPTGISAASGNAKAVISWTAGTGSTSSLIQYGTTSGVYGTPIDPATSPQTITGLTNETTNYYKVGAKNGTGTTWSAEYSLTPSATPPAISLTSPANGAVAAVDYLDYFPLSATLSWNNSRPGTNYNVQVATDSSFATLFNTSGWIAGAGSYTAANYTTGTYYWRVQAQDTTSLLVGPWSPTWSFMVQNWGLEPKSSCPYVFVWDGTEYRYVTDIHGPFIGPDIRSITNGIKSYQTNHIVLNDLKPDNKGRYRVKIREPLPEITYFDEAKLLTADYPKGYEILSSTSENNYPYGYANPIRIYTIKDPRLPISATYKDGRDILATVSKVDNDPAPAGRDSLEYYTFDFGKVKNSANAKLIIDGWSVYGKKYRVVDKDVQPFIEVADKQGRWVKVKSFGELSGDMKRMVIDIADAFLSDDHRIRLHLGLRIGNRWRIDRIMLDDSEPVPVTIHEVRATSADLHHKGKAPYTVATLTNRITATDGVEPDDQRCYSYGKFTRYGNVRELLEAKDDKFVIMRHGDEISMEFPALQSPAKGMQRGFMLKADLFYKGIELSNSVEPLPFHGMSAYPYPATEGYPRDKDHLEYLERYNTREYRQETATGKVFELLGVRNAHASDMVSSPGAPKKNEAAPSAQVEFKTAHPAAMPPNNSPDAGSWQWLWVVSARIWSFVVAAFVWLKSLVGL